MIRILMAEDVQVLRSALVALLSLEPDLEVVAELGTGDEVVARARQTAPDVAVLDIDLPGTDGITAAGQLAEALPGCRTLILTSLGRPGNLRRALAAQVSGFLLKDIEPAQLADAIRTVAAGGRVVDPVLALAALDSTPCPLTEREREVLRQAAEGTEPGQIAAGLHLSPGTVRNYLTAAVTKLNARNRVDAIRIAREADWL
ncbi:DNA-binding response regulator [Kitasatospora phosalacinea]|uniref:DNA-binding response regulator n=1 Tax=Kitasatospora phosalacinea TaxID=2065 RepID=A0A9W6Q3I5_9ACTN|nr:response regulator transcription factor [Kitasatospora phosalacinea]GLW69280.1 DNA-binding response regulator [Kitasatospora phosalacinea]